MGLLAIAALVLTVLGLLTADRWADQDNAARRARHQLEHPDDDDDDAYYETLW